MELVKKLSKILVTMNLRPFNLKPSVQYFGQYAWQLPIATHSKTHISKRKRIYEQLNGKKKVKQCLNSIFNLFSLFIKNHLIHKKMIFEHMNVR